jgi:hypothetical protein
MPKQAKDVPLDEVRERFFLMTGMVINLLPPGARIDVIRGRLSVHKSGMWTHSLIGRALLVVRRADDVRGILSGFVLAATGMSMENFDPAQEAAALTRLTDLLDECRERLLRNVASGC